MTKKIEYIVNGRYNYYAIDEYVNDGISRVIMGGLTKKMATSFAYYLNQAYNDGVRNTLLEIDEKVKKIQI